MKVERADVKKAVVAELERKSEETATYILNSVNVEDIVDAIMAQMDVDKEIIIENFVYDYLKTDYNIDELKMVKSMKARKN